MTLNRRFCRESPMIVPPRTARLLTLTDVAEQLVVSSKTVRRWVEQGDLRTHRLGRQLRVSEEDLQTFLGSRRR